jgi:wyosine [tRNA(Phe)-imidazoG37] synthetase (radical SAM superfamily)
LGKYKYLFGPLPSRRLGLSLGIDIIPKKLCTLNCVYCEIGATTGVTANQKRYYRAELIIPELEDYLSKSPDIDFLTFSGAGEPTLNSDIGNIIRFMKERFPSYKTAVITNGTLLGKAAVRDALLLADVVMPSLDAVSETAFKLINRPLSNFTAEEHIKGLLEFSKVFRNSLWLEIFIIPGINNTEEELSRLKEAVLKINPEKVQLNSLARPGTVDWIIPADEVELAEAAEFFKPLPVEIIKSFKKNHSKQAAQDSIQNKILLRIVEKEADLETLSKELQIPRKILAPVLAAMVDNNVLSSTGDEEAKYAIRRQGAGSEKQ